MIHEIEIPHTAADVATLQLEAEASGAFPDFLIETPDEYASVDAWLSDVVRKKDAVVSMRQTATGPLKATIKVIDGWFLPVVRALERSETRLKGHMQEYQLAVREADRKARLAVATAPEGDELMMALATASAAPPAGRATTSFGWAVKRVLPDLLPDEYWIPDEKRLAEVARAHKGDEPPVIPGVVFESIVRIGARR